MVPFVETDLPSLGRSVTVSILETRVVAVTQQRVL